MSERGLAFSALLCPAGVHVVAYRRTRAGLQVERYNRELRPVSSADDVSRILANLLESEGARGRRVSIAITGFGSSHQILTLPRAGREVLRPIVVRELRRFYPDLFSGEDADPIVEFVELDTAQSSSSPQHDLLVAAVPRNFLQGVSGALAARGIRVDHWTIAPRALQRLFDAFADAGSTAAALVMVPGWPLLGFFHERELRLFSEPRSGPGTTFAGVGAVIEHVERGSIFLRQQFRGATVGQLYLAAGPEGELPEGEETLSHVLDVAVTRFGPANEPPGAFAALGAALDAVSGDGLNLLPAELRPPSESERWTRRFALATVCVLLLAAGWWAWSARRAEAAAREEIAAATARLTAQSSVLGTVRPIIDERQAHAHRAAILALLSRERRRLPEVLWPLQAAAPDVEVRRLEVQRTPEGWQVLLGLTATAMSYDVATDAITAITQQIGAELPEDAVTVSAIELQSSDSTGARAGPLPIAASVEMSFDVPARKGRQE